MLNINFTKMHGLGNDFIIVESKELADNIDVNSLAAKLCDRHFGIGADGLILINPSINDTTDTSWRILNSDGTEPEMCGNGIRCFAKYVYDKGIINKKEFTVSTLAGTIIPKIEEDGQVTVNMGAPILNPAQIPVKISTETALNYPLQVLDREFNINCVSMGNPHCIIFIDEQTNPTKYGPAIETNPIFPQKTNVEFVKVLSRTHLKVDVWERGCGITLACGTGACATAVAAILNGISENKVKISLPGGDLTINYDQDADVVYMSGPAEYSFQGTIQI